MNLTISQKIKIEKILGEIASLHRLLGRPSTKTKQRRKELRQEYYEFQKYTTRYLDGCYTDAGNIYSTRFSVALDGRYHKPDWLIKEGL